ncbi:MAG: glycosyl hydrolase 108 family protein [Alphaproteobacteria bacterium]
MKKVFCYFLFGGLAFVGDANAVFFYADAVENAIKESFAENIQQQVASEYEAQMNPLTGEITEYGLYNVCYAGGADVSTAKGAEKCAGFIEVIQNTCVYSSGNGLGLYKNPITPEDKLKKCIFDKALDFAFDYEGEFQQNPKDIGNRICEKDSMKPIKDKNGNYLLGATKYGITTCASKLSVECIKKMTKYEARTYYWTHFYRKYRYYALPSELLAIVMEYSLGGVGTVRDEIALVTGKSCSSSVINDCVIDGINEYLQNNSIQDFYEKMRELRVAKRTGQQKRRAEASIELLNAYQECVEK